MRIYIRRQPKSLALVSDDKVLAVRNLGTKPETGEPLKCVVEFTDKNEFDLAGWSPQLANCLGCLGLIHVGSDIFLCTITSRSEAAQPMPDKRIWRIHGVEFYCLTKHSWPLLDPASYAGDSANAEKQEHPCYPIHKLLTDGSFYYSTAYDLTAVLQTSTDENNFATPLDISFMWNHYMVEELAKFRQRLLQADQEKLDRAGFLACAIRGFIETVPVNLDQKKGRLSVISRQSWRRAGTRYNARGIDDSGNVANFVETETFLWLENDQKFDYVQLRGSVPVFWEQEANLLGAKVSIQRSHEATQPAFAKHFESLVDRFGAVYAINLLSTKQGEAELTAAYERQFRDKEATSLRQAAKYIHFDFHREVAQGQGYGAASKVIEKVQDSMLEFGFFSFNPTTKQIETEQIGVFRTNCLDCLDRTNLVQQLISRDALDLFLDYNNIYPTDELWSAHAVLWADNGDQLSMIYAGTNALKSSYTRSGKMNFAGAISDVTKSVGRLYVNNFVDKSRQTTIELMLGRGDGQLKVIIYDPINDWVQSELTRRKEEFSTARDICIFTGTFNLNGRAPDADLTPWLFPRELTQYPDLYLIGLQELVELSPGQILNTDATRRRQWEDGIAHCLNKHEHYVMLRSGQLVGTGILLFVKRSEMNFVTKIEGSAKKTAFGGMAGNKGGVAISFKYASTRICFLNAHLAAGQNNLDERHQQYQSLYKGLRFTCGRRVKDHDSIIWVGDFNYRVDLPNDTVRTMLERDAGGQDRSSMVQRLFDFDQLNIQMQKGETFPFFKEMDISFLPTYKFDIGSDNYDTSEKARTPSWTDRILHRGSNMRQKAYNCVNKIKFSDHRPVYALFDTTVLVVNKDKKQDLYSQLYDARRKQLAKAGPNANESFLQRQPHTGLGLPPPSTDTEKWWAGEGQTSKIPILPPRANAVLNPAKINPFSPEGVKQPDFVDGSRDISEVLAPYQSRQSTSSLSSQSSSKRKAVPPTRVAVPSQSSISLIDDNQSVGSKSSTVSASQSLLDTPVEEVAYKSIF